MSIVPSLVLPPAGGHDHVHEHPPGEHGHTHAHAPGSAHAPANAHAPAPRSVRRAYVPPSLLRASLAQRLAVAIPVAIVLWALALWVIQGSAA